MKRSKKKQMVRKNNNAGQSAFYNAAANALRLSDPETYYAKKVEAYDSMILKHQVADEALRKAYDKGVDDGGLTITENLGVTFTSAMCRALHDKYGFGKKRLVELMGAMNEIMLNTFTTVEAVQAVYKEIGLRFSQEDPFNWLSFDEE